MKRVWIVTWLLAMLVAGLCRAQPARPEYVGLARPQGKVERVVSLAPNLTEIVFSLGAGEKVVGVTRFDDYPLQVKDLPRVGGFLDPSLEAIMGLKPDLVLCVPNSGNRSKILSLSRLKVPVLLLPAYGLSDVYSAITTLGEVLDEKERAREIVHDMQRRARAVATRTAGRKRPRVLLVYGHRPMVAAGPGTFADELLRLAGAKNVMAKSRVRYPTLPMEMVVRLAPDVIIDASSSGFGAVMSLEEVRSWWQRWKVIPAVRNNRVHLFDSALWFRPGPRLVKGLERLERILHPDS